MLTKKDFIEDLYRRRSDFKDPDQAETMSNLLDTVSSDIYSESQRFVFELIQNADDAAKNTNNEVHFEFRKDCLIVSHNGHPFTQDDIKALTSAGSSTKQADTRKTGYKGIGFKSVFGKSPRVTIFSDGFQFRFDKAKFDTTLPWQIIPIWTELSDLANGIQESLLASKYAVSTIIEIKNVDVLQNDLNDLLSNGQILLFLRRVSKISVSKNGESIYVIEKKLNHEAATFNEVVLFKDGREISSWISKSFTDIPVPAKTKEELKHDEKTPKKLKDADFTEISFAAKIEGNQIRELKEWESLIFTYLPTKVNDFKFPFLVNGSFLTNAAREGIHEDKVWNQWLFELIAEKALDWLVALTQSKYKFQLLHLLPHKFNNQQNELKKSFDNSFSNHARTKKFIITENENITNQSEVILDKTGLTMQKFIDPKSITEFLQVEKKLILSDDCFVNAKVESAHKLKAIGVEIFELDNFETFFISKPFTSRHKFSDNFSLIKYFKEQSDQDKHGLWFQALKKLPFIFDEKGLLYNPSNGICFPTGVSSTELGDIPIIHPYVFERIQKDKPVYEWLKILGIKEPSKITFVTNVIIPNLKKEGYIHSENFLPITHYLFRLFKENQLDEEMLECLRELPLKTKNKELTFKEAQNCFLSNKYQPQLKIEGIIKEVSFVSEEYIISDSSELELNLFFKAIKVKDRVEIETITKNNSLPTLRALTSPVWVDKSYQKAKDIPGSYGHGEHNIITNVNIPSFLNMTSSSYEYSKLFWKNLIGSGNTLTRLLDTATLYYGAGNGENRFGCSVENYFPWFVIHEKCIPTSTEQLLNPENVFINDKEIRQIAGSYLPVFEFDEPLPDDWKELLRLKIRLELGDYLSILSKMVKHAEEVEEKESNFKPSLKRIGLIYNKLASMIPDMSTTGKKVIADWAATNKLLSENGNFESAVQLHWITIEGFSTKSDKLKTIQLPENCEKSSETLKELISLFRVQTIDEFVPMFDNVLPDSSLKGKLETILPYYVALVEKKKLEEGSQEFERIYQLLNETDFFSAAEIKLSFHFQSATFDGPSLTVYKGDNKFYFKGKWKSERTLLSLIKELSNLLGITGLNEELRFLLLEADNNEIHEWLIEQGIHLATIKPARKFAKRVIVTPQYEVENNPDHENGKVNKTTEYAPVVESTIPERFNPTVTPQSIDVSKISAKLKTFANATNKAEANYSIIQCQEIREDVGRWCEEFVKEYLNNQKSKYTEVIWENRDGESGKPYDFKIVENGIDKYIDVKGTPSATKDIIYLSPNEWVFMFEKGETYAIYRVYDAGDDARIEIIENPGGKLQQGLIFPNPITLQV